MDYEFKKNSFDGEFRVRLPMGHEVLARWIIEELGKDKVKLDLILDQLGALKDSPTEWKLEGEELTLVLEENEAIVMSNHMFNMEEEELDFGMQYNDDESVSACGFEDFELLLKAWHQFYTTGR